MALSTAEDVYILLFRADLLGQFVSQEEEPEGFEEAFESLYELTEQVTSSLWVDELLFYTTAQNRISYTVGGKVFQIDADKKAFLIGYVGAQNRLYLMDKYFSVISYEANLHVIEFQSLIVKGSVNEAGALLQAIPPKYFDKIARFLDTLNYKELAYKIVTDPDHKFDLALHLGLVDDAFQIAKHEQNSTKLRHVADLALHQGLIPLAIEAYDQAEDLNSLLLIYTSLGLKNQLESLADKAFAQTKMNIAFQSYFTLQNVDKCLEVLLKSQRFGEAAFFAKTYSPSKISQVVKKWKECLKNDHPVVSEKIGDPFDYPERFGDLELALKVEEFYHSERNNIKVPAHQF